MYTRAHIEQRALSLIILLSFSQQMVVEGVSCQQLRGILGSLRNAVVRAVTTFGVSAGLYGGYYYHSATSRTASEAYEQRYGSTEDFKSIAQSPFFIEERRQQFAKKVEELQERERQHLRDYVVFYHGEHQVVGYVQDILAAIFEWEQQQTVKDFIPVRFWRQMPPVTPNPMQYADYFKLDRKEYWRDHDKVIMRSLISANFALHGFHSDSSECSFSYWLNGKSVSSNWTQKEIEEIAAFYEFKSQFLINELNDDRAHRYQIHNGERGGRLLQIFIPKKFLNAASYIALPGGISAQLALQKENGLDLFPQLSLPFYTPSHLIRLLRLGFNRINYGKLQARLLIGQDILLNPKVVKIYSEDISDPRLVARRSAIHRYAINQTLVDWLDRVEQKQISAQALERIKDKPVYQLVTDPEKRATERRRLQQEIAQIIREYPDVVIQEEEPPYA